MRALLTAAGVALVFSLLVTPLFIKLFKKIGWGQYIWWDLPKTHEAKRGKPTMGGLVLISATLVGYFVGKFVNGESPTISALLVLYMMVGLGIVGFIDDYLKISRKQSLGLGELAKVTGQVIVAVSFAVAATLISDRGMTPASTAISLVRDITPDLYMIWGVAGLIIIWVWITGITVATTNAVNLTDGLDGLAAGASILSIGSFVIINFWQWNQSCTNINIDPEFADKCYEVLYPLDLAVVAAAICGALVGFLWHNTNPAKIIMGDNGSLALGGALAALAILSRTELLLVLIGGLFVVITLSVIIQRLYFKISGGKRVFLMAPLHHHFELKGWQEVTIVVRFWIIAGLFAAAGIGIFYTEWLYR